MKDLHTSISFSTGVGEPVRDNGGSSPSALDDLLGALSFCLKTKNHLMIFRQRSLRIREKLKHFVRLD